MAAIVVPPGPVTLLPDSHHDVPAVTLHTLLVWFPAPMLVLALLLDVLDMSASAEGGVGRRGRRLVAGAVGIVVLASFTGLGARRTLPAAVPGSPMPPWDVHVNWAVVLLIPVLAVGFVRIRAVGGPWRRAPGRLLLLDLALLVLVSAITATGLRIP